MDNPNFHDALKIDAKCYVRVFSEEKKIQSILLDS